MGIRGGIAVTGKMLPHADDPGLPHPAVHPGGGIRRPAGVAAVGAVSDDGVLRVAPHIRHRSKIQVEAEGRAFHAQGLSQPCQLRRVVPLSKGIGARKVHYLLRHPGDPSSLLVHTEEKGHGVCVELLEAVGQLGQLTGALHVAAEEDDAAHLILLHRLDRVRAGRGALNARHQQLPYHLLRRHPGQLLRDRVRGGRGLRRGGRLRRGGGFRGGRGQGRTLGHGGILRPGPEGAGGGQCKYNQ